MKTVWFWKGPPLDGKWFNVANYHSDAHSKPSTIFTDTKPDDETIVSSVSLDEHGNLKISLDDEQFASCPDIWFVLEETEYPTPMVTLHGLKSDIFPKGTVIKVKDIRGFGIRQDEYVGFIKWFRQDSRIQQIFVDDNHRRQRVSTTLIGAADIVIIAGEYGTYLNGGDVTTNDGEKLRQAWDHSSRVIPKVGSVTPVPSHVLQDQDQMLAEDNCQS